MNEYKPTIGLEIHAELKTNTKMFCSCVNNPEERKPNANICQICMAYPGTLPVVNKSAIKHVLKVGFAMGGKIADFTEFDRKNYFYPDIPKGYQISQYKYPLISGGSLVGVDITRIHLEEDTARSTHDSGDYSLVDFNRAGLPLMELVTEPIIHDSKTAVKFAKELQLLLRYLGAGDANMEKGQMRVEANVSVSKDDKLGTKVEVKNINSFKAVQGAIEYEIKRQIEALENGEKLVQETRGWNENTGSTFSQRKKEEANDYRYFPDPDIPKFKLSQIEEFSEEVLRAEFPELPWERRERYEKAGMKTEDSEVFVINEEYSRFVDVVLQSAKEDKFRKDAINFITSDLLGLLKNIDGARLPSPDNFVVLINMKVSGDITTRVAKDILAVMVKEDNDPHIIKENLGIVSLDQNALEGVVKRVIEENESVVEQYKGGNEKVLMFLVGQVMKETKGSSDPQSVKEMLKSLIS